MSDTKKLESSRAWKAANKERVRAYDRERNRKRYADPETRKLKLEADSKTRKKYAAKWRAYDKGRDAQKVSARNIIRQRVKRGTLKRQPCEACGATPTQAHHDDYSKPLEVRWLCPKHHKEAHNV